MTNQITIIGSINVDRILHIDQLPEAGETISMTDLTLAAGGKGANQAIAAVRSGAQTNFIGAVGNDADGIFMLEQMTKNGINTEGIQTVHHQPTGQAYILLQASGQNSIVISSGANACVDADLVAQNQKLLSTSDFVITQSETPESAAIAGFKLAHSAGATTILNPAPASKISAELLSLTDIIVPNETESQTITGIEYTGHNSLLWMSKYFHERGVKAVIITLGSTGSYLSFAGQNKIIPANKVKAVDTTAAGDTFIGSFASELKTDFSNIEQAMQYDTTASGLAVQKLGAFPSIPTRTQIMDYLNSNEDK